MCAGFTSAVAAGADLYDLRVVFVCGMALATGAVFCVDLDYRRLAPCRSGGWFLCDIFEDSSGG